MPPTASDPGVFNPRNSNADYFWYSNRVTGLSSVSTTATGLINLDSDSDFYCVGMSYTADIAAAALTESTNVLPLITVLITDTSSGKALMNTPVPIPSIMGDGKRPYRFVRPRVFPANGTIQLAYTAYVAAGTTYNITVTLHGYKVYR